MNNLDLGLKDFFISSSKTKPRLKHFFRTLRHELRYALQRAWKGYDNVDIDECYEMFRRRMIRIIDNLNKHGNSLLSIPIQSKHYKELVDIFPQGYFNEEYTEIIYQTMIYHLQMMNEDFVEKILFGTNIYDNDYKIGCRTMEDHKKIYIIMEQNKDAFMKLFSLFYFNLYD